MSLIVEPEIEKQIGDIVAGLLEYHKENHLEYPSKLNIKVSRDPNGSNFSYRAVLVQMADPFEYQLKKLQYLKR
jgi:hypothetical protein